MTIEAVEAANNHVTVSKNGDNHVTVRKISRLRCYICYERFSAKRRSRQPFVGKCGHSFCRFCATKMKGKCARCRTPIKPKKNFEMIEVLEETICLRKQNKELKEKLKSAGIDCGEEEGEESEGEEDDEQLQGGEESEKEEELEASLQNEEEANDSEIEDDNEMILIQFLPRTAQVDGNEEREEEDEDGLDAENNVLDLSQNVVYVTEADDIGPAEEREERILNMLHSALHEIMGNLPEEQQNEVMELIENDRFIIHHRENPNRRQD